VELHEQRSRADNAEHNVDNRANNGRDDDEQRWNDAVARHGFAAADAANKVLVEIEKSREAIERAETEEPRPETIRALKQERHIELMKAAELGVAGNGLIREVAEFDEALRTVLQAVEREREKTGREKFGAGSEMSETVRQDERGAPSGEWRQTINAERRSVDETRTDERGDVPGRNEGDMTRTDPAQQRLLRLEELQREADERNERDRDERER
jgi:hypothetical protein